MALYKITSGLTTAVDFEDKTVRIPSTTELTDEEAAVVSKVADLVQVDKEFDNAKPVKDVDSYVAEKAHEEKTVGNDVEEATPKLNFK